MKLQEQIRRILREEDFIPLESLNTVIKDYEDGFDVFIMNKDKKIGEISFVKDNLPNAYTIVDATIDDEYKGNRIYPKTIINLFKERPNIIINSVFRSPEAEKSWRHLLSNLPSNIGKSVKYYKEEDTTLYQLKLRNLQEQTTINEDIDLVFLRRSIIIKDLIDRGVRSMKNDVDLCDYSFREFLTEMCWQVSDNRDELIIDTNENRVIEKIHDWVKDNFYYYIKDQFDKLLSIKKCNELTLDDDEDDLSGFLYGVDNNQ